MTIQPPSHQNTCSPDFTSLIKNDRYGLFTIVAANLKPQHYLNFLCTSKIVYEINNKLKKDEKNTFYQLFIKILSNKLSEKPLDELSTELITYCKNAGKINKCRDDKEKLFIEFKNFFNALIACGKFKEMSAKTLQGGFISCCIYNHSDMAKIFINSNRFNDLSVQALQTAFTLSGSNEGEETTTLIDCSRFKEISPECLGDLLITASTNRYVGSVKAIIESPRAHEISLKDYIKSLDYAAHNSDDNIEKKLEILRMLINFPKFTEVPQESLIKILIGSAMNWRGDEVVELIQASNFNTISREQLNRIFYVCIDRFHPVSMKFFIESHRFDEITTENLGKALQEAAQYKKSEILQAIVRSSRFDEINLQDFIKAMHTSCGVGFNNVDTIPIENLKTLINTPQFSKLDSKVLEKLMLRARSAKRRDPIRPQYDYDRKDAVEVLRPYVSEAVSSAAMQSLNS